MKEIFLEQGSQEWLEYRSTRIGASDAPIIMGLSPWSTPLDLYKDKVEGKTKKSTKAMDIGKAYEAEARAYFEKMLMMRFTPKVGQHDKIDWLMASYDGISDDGKTALEIKIPSSPTLMVKAMSGEIPDYYHAQMQQQYAVNDKIERMIYAVYDYRQQTGEVIECNKDNEFIKKMLKEELKFYECMVQKTPPGETTKNGDDIVLENSDEFIQVSEKYKELDMAIKLMLEDKNIARERLIEIADNRQIKGNGISLTKKKVEGRIDMKAIPFDLKEQLEQFRTAPTESYTIRID